MLDKHMTAIRDNGFLPETMAGEGWMERREARVYPLSRVIKPAVIVAPSRVDGLAAEALTRFGDPREPVALLTATIDEPPSWRVQLHALNALNFVGQPAQPALPSMLRAAESEQ